MKIDKEALYASSLGIEIALSIGLGMFFGWWLDNKFSTSPWLFIVFFMAGIGSAIKAVMRIIKLVENENPEGDHLENSEVIERIDGYELTRENFSDDENLPD